MRNKKNIPLEADDYIKHKYMNAVRQNLQIDSDLSEDLSTSLLVGIWLAPKWDAQTEQDAEISLLMQSSEWSHLSVTVIHLVYLGPF